MIWGGWRGQLTEAVSRADDNAHVGPLINLNTREKVEGSVSQRQREPGHGDHSPGWCSATDHVSRRTFSGRLARSAQIIVKATMMSAALRPARLFSRHQRPLIPITSHYVVTDPSILLVPSQISKSLFAAFTPAAFFFLKKVESGDQTVGEIWNHPPPHHPPPSSLCSLHWLYFRAS